MRESIDIIREIVLPQVQCVLPRVANPPGIGFNVPCRLKARPSVANQEQARECANKDGYRCAMRCDAMCVESSLVMMNGVKSSQRSFGTDVKS